MTGLLIAFTIVALVPLFAATWRTSLLGLSLQGALLAWLALRHGATLSIDTGLTVIDTVVLRALLAPAVIYVVMLDRNGPARNDVIAANLFSWATAIGLVVVAFRTADALIPAEGDEQMLVAVSSAAFLLGMLVLSTARGTLSQIIGLLRIENAIALFELGGSHPQGDRGIRIGMTVLLFASIAFCRWYLTNVPREGQPESVADTGAL
jgi:hydrogenase-4 component E